MKCGDACELGEANALIYALWDELDDSPRDPFVHGALSTWTGTHDRPNPVPILPRRTSP